jgi:hypothetical protein
VGLAAALPAFSSPTSRGGVSLGEACPQVMALHRPYIRSCDGFERPWSQLEQFAEGLTVAEFAYGTGHVAVSRVPSDKPSAYCRWQAGTPGA